MKSPSGTSLAADGTNGVRNEQRATKRTSMVSAHGLPPLEDGALKREQHNEKTGSTQQPKVLFLCVPGLDAVNNARARKYEHR